MSDNPMADFEEYVSKDREHYDKKAITFFVGYACGAAGVTSTLKEVVDACKQATERSGS